MNDQLKHELESSEDLASEALLENSKKSSSDSEQQVSNQDAKPEYSGVYQQAFQEKIETLESDIPSLENGIGQRVNRKAIVFLGVMGLVIASIVTYAMSKSSAEEEPAQVQQSEEMVNIPSSPVPAFVPTEEASSPNQQMLPKPPELTAVPNSQANMENISIPPSPTTMEQPVMNDMAAANSMPAGNPSMEYANSAANSPTNSRTGDAGNFVVSENGSTNSGGPGSRRLQAQKLYKPDYLLVQGTYIRCVLSSRIVSDIPGNASCVITEPVYSTSGAKLLIPKGSRAIGSYGSGTNVGNRIGVIWNRIITPNNLDIQMTSLGTDNLGGNGHPGDYRSHWASRLGSSILISLIGDGVDYIGDKNSSEQVTTTSTSTTISPTETKTAKTLEKIAQEELNRLGMRPATITINQGEILNIFVSQDVDFENVIKD